MEISRYIEEISKYCDPHSILVVVNTGQLVRIYCPFSVLVVNSVGNLEKGDIAYVQAVRITLELRDVFIIAGKAYYFFYFKILL